MHTATLSRERRKEQREAAHRVIEEIKDIEESALAFHTQAGHSQQSADGLTSRINRMIRSLQRAPLKVLDTPLGPMIRFRKSITLENFDSSTFSTQHAESTLLYSIRAATDDLIGVIESQRDKNVP